MNKLLILDKDGTLTKTISGEKFVQHPEDQKIIPGASKAVNYAKQQGYKIAIASNQGGVKAGFKTIEEALQEFIYLGVI